MKPGLSTEEYLRNPCRASSLPFWKTEQFEIPESVCIYREDEFGKMLCSGADEPYFRMIHLLQSVQYPRLPDDYILTKANIGEFADHILECYTEESVTAEKLEACTHTQVYDPNLWIAIREKATYKIVASGIGEFDDRIGEGILDWIQVTPDYRRRGLGQAVVCELIKRLSGKADFITVSGRMNNPCNPLALYEACGFSNPVIWHIVTR